MSPLSNDTARDGLRLRWTITPAHDEAAGLGGGRFRCR